MNAAGDVRPSSIRGNVLGLDLYVDKNFILLTRKFGGDLSKALLAQSDSPLGYGSEFKPIETLKLNFRNHPSCKLMPCYFGQAL